MSQRPHGRLSHPGPAPQRPGHAPIPGRRPAAQGPAANIVPGIAVVVWSGIALLGGVAATAYLGLGAVVTNNLDSVFGDGPNGVFNWAVLLVALIGQLVGLIASVSVMLLGIGARKRHMRRGATAMVLGIAASVIFLLIGLIQLPLLSLFFDALQLTEA